MEKSEAQVIIKGEEYINLQQCKDALGKILEGAKFINVPKYNGWFMSVDRDEAFEALRERIEDLETQCRKATACEPE